MKLLPAQLWIGQHHTLVQEAMSYLRSILCTKNCNNSCITCNQIQRQEHHAITWLLPETQYTLDQIIHIQQSMSFTLEFNEKHFFVLQKAHYLTPLCANRLLKSVEEPPNGYHFLFLAPHKEGILKTIQSRCITRIFSLSKIDATPHPLYIHFTQTDPDPSLFEKDLSTSLPNELESNELMHALFQYWIQDRDTLRISILAKALQRPAMSGSSKLFWKNLFLQWLI